MHACSRYISMHAHTNIRTYIHACGYLYYSQFVLLTTAPPSFKPDQAPRRMQACARYTRVCTSCVYIRIHAHIYVYTHIYKYTRTYIHTRGCTIHTRTSFLYVPPSCKPSTALRTQRSVCTFKYFVLPKALKPYKKITSFL